MGYYTTYNLEIMPWSDEIIEDFRKTSEDAKYGLDESGDSNDGIKWYEHDNDMTKLSKKYPNHIFKLEGDGEENGDQWKKYYKNGECQVCNAKITFDDPTDPFLATQEQMDAAEADQKKLIQEAYDAKLKAIEDEKAQKIKELEDKLAELRK